MLFMKPTHAVVGAEGGIVTLPADKGEVHYEAEVVLFVGRDYTPGISVDDLVTGMALGIDFTLRTVQDGLKAKGHPWLAAKGFRQSAPLGQQMSYPGTAAAADIPFTLQINGLEVQRGKMAEMIFPPQTIIDFVAENYGLRAGDIIFTGTPAGVGVVQDGDRFELFWNGEPTGSFTAQLAADLNGGDTKPTPQAGTF
jgi:2-keto-4-pentenoate hydratase/2-oxohepta-3-ene-1,7-dioic acid hydratase in catechol pathway